MQAQFLIHHFLLLAKNIAPIFLFPPFLVSSAVISSYFLRQSLLFSSPFCGRCHSQDERSLPVLPGTVQYTITLPLTLPYHITTKTRTKEVACCLCVSTVRLSDTTTSSQPIDVANIRGSRSTTRPASLITSTFPLQLVATTFDWLKQRPCSYGCVLLVYAVCSKRQLDADRTLIECQNRSVVVNMARLRGRRPADLSQEPPHTTTQDHITLYQGTGRCRISHLYRYVCTVRTDRRPFLVPTSNPISCFLSPEARY